MHLSKRSGWISRRFAEKCQEKNGINLIIGQVQNLPPNDLRSLAAQVNKRCNPSVVLLASRKTTNARWSAFVHHNDGSGTSCGSYLSELASKLEGKGGKPDFAMGGASANRGLAQALAYIPLTPNF